MCSILVHTFFIYALCVQDDKRIQESSDADNAAESKRRKVRHEELKSLFLVDAFLIYAQ